jgi:hypothetical protein
MTPLPLPLALADELYRHGSTNTPNTVADELVRLHNEIEALLEFVQEWLDRQGTDNNYMTAKARAAIARTGEKK